MEINLFRDLERDETSPEVRAAREAAEQYETVIDSLVLMRKEAELSQADISRRMGTTQSAVSDIERLGSDLRVSTLQRYAAACGAAVIFEIRPVLNVSGLAI